jgi:hypothetical protein
VKNLLALTTLAACAAVSGALAQTPPPCTGHYEVIRTDTIKPGKMDLFKKAVQDHQAWYKAHGLSDRIFLGEVLTPGVGFSPTTAMTVHTDMKAAGAPPHAPDDAAWNAYVAEYKASSDVVSTSVVCLYEPK